MGDCHYLDGNVKAEKEFGSAKELVTMLGIEPERVRLEWISSAEGTRFAEVAQEFTEQIKSLGPLKIEDAA
ncbi:MAG: hydrogenase iron-sulfur subunit [Desulforhopalus sp.]|nr:hydrogenase iron-sulfur subunit [Desulforhopalus sp.]